MREILYEMYLDVLDLKTAQKVWSGTYQVKKPYNPQDVEF